MKFTLPMASLFSLSLLLAAPAGAAEPAACSVSVGIVTQFGSYRTWTNALETQILADKGLTICQDDAILSLSDNELADLDGEKAAKLLGCQTEFRLELLYHPDQLTRNLTIKGNGKELFDRDYTPQSGMRGSLKILKTMPTCAELQALAAKSDAK